MTGNWMFVGAAYALTWVVLLGYLLHLRRTSRRAHALLEGAASASR
jgi:CcmD family protein